MLTDTASSGGSASFLIGIYHRLFGTASHPSIVRYNDFSDVAGYLIQKELHTSVAGVRGGQNQSPVEVRTFLLEVLKYSDNQMNKVSICGRGLMSSVFASHVCVWGGDPVHMCEYMCVGMVSTFVWVR